MKKNKVLGVILARGGSKGIPKKNIKNLCGHPLISYSIYAGLQSKYIDKLIVSTDDSKISKIAEIYGAEVPFMRPKKLARDKVWSRDALKHAVLTAEKKFKIKYDFIVEIPAVAPLRPYHQIDNAIEKLIKTKSDSVIAVTKVFDKHPVRIKKIKNDLIVDYNNTLKEGESSRRQELPSCYVRNGSIYAMKRETLIKDFSRKGKISRPLIMREKYSINIDEMSDFYLAENMIKRGNCENYPASLVYNKQINIYKTKSNSDYILISYPEEISKNIFKRFIPKYNLIFCDVKNLINIKESIRKKIKIWITHTNGNIFIDEKKLNLFQNLKTLASPSTGLTHLDAQIIKKKKLNLIYLNDSQLNKNIKSSSEFALALILMTLRNINEGFEKVIEGNWRNKENELRSNELSNIKFGIFGLGRIGKNLANYLAKFGSKIYYMDPNVKFRNKFIKKEINVKKFLKKINFLIISSTLNKKTENFFNYRNLKFLPKGSKLVNISRGELIIEKDLIKLIKSGHISKASLDVIRNEKSILSSKNNLINFSRINKNLKITPHIAGLTYDSEKKALIKIFNSIEKVI